MKVCAPFQFAFKSHGVVSNDIYVRAVEGLAHEVSVQAGANVTINVQFSANNADGYEHIELVVNDGNTANISWAGVDAWDGSIPTLERRTTVVLQRRGIQVRGRLVWSE